MNELLLLLAGLLLAGNGWLIVEARSLRLQALELQQAAEEALRQRREIEVKRGELIEKQRIAEQLLDHGSIGVETVHKAIAGLTFGILETIPGVGQSSRTVRQTHDAVAAETYEAVRKLNRQVGQFLKDALKPPDGGDRE